MSPVAAGLDGLLALLLVAALMLGVRLNARLKTLRDSQAGFAAAVIELNKAAARAEAGLAALKTAQEGAHEELLGRIEVARGLVTKLERAGAEAERRAALTPERSFDPSPRTAPRPADGPPSGGALAAIAALAEGRGAARHPPPVDPASRKLGAEMEPAGAAQFVPPPRRAPARGAFDEDLFAAPVARREESLGLNALDHTAAARAPTASAPRPTPPAPVETRLSDDTLDLGPLADPLSKWKTVR